MPVFFKNSKIVKKGIFTLFLLSAFACSAPMALADSPAGRALQGLQETLSLKGIIDDPAQAPTAAQIVGGVINMALGIFGLIFLILIIYGGIIWMTAGGNEQKADRAVKILTEASLGLIIIISAYIFTNLVVFRFIGIFT